MNQPVKKKAITAQTHLTALALFTMGNMHCKKMREYERALSDLLGYPPDDYYLGCLSDELADDTDGNFERGMKKEGFVVAPDQDQQ